MPPTPTTKSPPKSERRTAPQAAARRSRAPESAPPDPPSEAPRRARIVAFGGQKGGAGKTTSAIATACEWQRRGRRVLVVDTDPQGSARTWADLAGELGTTIPTVVAMGAGLHQPSQLPRLAADHDVVVIDCPPRLDTVQRAVLMVSDLVVLPCGPSTLDTWALAESLATLRQAQQLRPSLAARVLVTRKQPHTVVGRAAREVIASTGLAVLGAELAFRVTYQEAPAAGLGPTTYAPDSDAAGEVRALVDELEGLL